MDLRDGRPLQAMIGRSRKRHLWFAILYGLATLVVQVGHDHGARRTGPEVVAEPGCDDPRPHYASHGAPELIRGDLHCPACQFRAEHQAGADRPTAVSVATQRLATPFDSPRLRPASTSWPRSRAPPLA
jgi:hypothetical protein